MNFEPTKIILIIYTNNGKVGFPVLCLIIPGDKPEKQHRPACQLHKLHVHKGLENFERMASTAAIKPGEVR